MEETRRVGTPGVGVASVAGAGGGRGPQGGQELGAQEPGATLRSSPIQRILYLDESRGEEWLRFLCETYRFRVVGMRVTGGPSSWPRRGPLPPPAPAPAPTKAQRSIAGPEVRRAWVLARPGIARPLAVRGHRFHLIFDLNGVLAAKIVPRARALGGAPTCSPRPPAWAHVRMPPPSPMCFLLRPGAAKLLRMLDAEGHWVWLWSTMQPQTVHTLAYALAPWLPQHRLLAAPDCGPGKEQPVKDLRTVWRRSQRDPAAPAPEHTLLFDDDPAKALPEHRDKHYVRVAPFAPISPWDFAVVQDRETLRILGLIATHIHAPESDRAE